PQAPHADPRQMVAQLLDALHALLPPAAIREVPGRMEEGDDVRGILPRRAEHLRLSRELEVPKRTGLEGLSQLAQQRILELDVTALRALDAGMPLDPAREPGRRTAPKQIGGDEPVLVLIDVVLEELMRDDE